MMGSLRARQAVGKPQGVFTGAIFGLEGIHGSDTIQSSSFLDLGLSKVGKLGLEMLKIKLVVAVSRTPGLA